MNERSLIFRGVWLASSASTDGCCERVVFCRTRGSRAR